MLYKPWRLLLRHFIHRRLFHINFLFNRLLTLNQSKGQPSAHFLVRFLRDDDFVGREDILRQISDSFESQRRVALDGIGGIE